MPNSQANYENNSQMKKSAGDAVTSLKEEFENIGRVGAKLADQSFDQVREGVKGYYQKGQQKFTQVEGMLENAILAHPLRSLAIAAGVGFLVAKLRRK